MIIEHVPVDGVKKTTDTDKLSDVEAMILEKCEELRKLCMDSRRRLFLAVDAKGLGDGTCMQFWNIMATPGDTTKMSPKTIHEETNAFLNMVNFGIIRLTGGSLELRSVDPDGNTEE